MSTTVWCELTDAWLRRNGVDDLDPCQRLRLQIHLADCARCQIGTGRLVSSSDWPHLADATLADWLADQLTSGEREAVGDALQSHLASCRLCHQRLELLKWTGRKTESDNDVVATSAPTLIEVARTADYGVVEWVIDRPHLDLRKLTLTLELKDESIQGDLVADPTAAMPLPSWTTGWSNLTVVLTSASGLMGSLVFSPASPTASLQVRARPEPPWHATPILTAKPPRWQHLLFTGDHRETMVPMSRLGQPSRVRIPSSPTLQHAVAHPRAFRGVADPEMTAEVKTLEKELSSLFCDLRGAPVRVEFSFRPESRAPSESMDAARPPRALELHGRLFDLSGSEIGQCEARTHQRSIELFVIPASGSVVRLSPEQDDLLEEPITDSFGTHYLIPTEVTGRYRIAHYHESDLPRFGRQVAEAQARAAPSAFPVQVMQRTFRVPWTAWTEFYPGAPAPRASQVPTGQLGLAARRREAEARTQFGPRLGWRATVERLVLEIFSESDSVFLRVTEGP